MASIRKTIVIQASAEHCWSALRDFGNVHRRLASGFVVDAHVDAPGSRVVTFADGRIAREVLVTADDADKRLVYAIVGGRMSHHSASAQVFAEDDGRCRFVWITDLLPDEFAPTVESMMASGAEAMKRTLEASA